MLADLAEKFRARDLTLNLAKKIKEKTSRTWTLMEVCGGQTNTIVRNGIDHLVEGAIELIHGPGCPVCVTASTSIEHAIRLSMRPNTVLCTFGDMLRVPSREGSLLDAKALGGQVKVVYSPLDAVKFAHRHSELEVVLFAVGFETTAPATALAVRYADQMKLSNFSLLVTHVLVPPALKVLLESENNQVNAFLAAGHVCTVMGVQAYHEIARLYEVPIVITGFEPVDLLRGMLATVVQLEQGESKAENLYERSVDPEGNLEAQSLLSDVYEPIDRHWRGLGLIPMSGLGLRPKYHRFDAEAKFDAEHAVGKLSNKCQDQDSCQAGAVLTGLQKPEACPHFGGACTPESPLGAPMVSEEGACAAYFKYRSLG